MRTQLLKYSVLWNTMMVLERTPKHFYIDGLAQGLAQ